MSNYSFVRLSDGATIPLIANNDPIAIAMLAQSERTHLSMIGEGSPEYLFAKSDRPTFWCKPGTPVYRAKRSGI